MKLTLDIYKENSQEIEKTYTAETVNFSFGVVEDIINALKVDDLDLSNKSAIALRVIKGISVLKPLLKDIFEGVTDDEIRRTRINNIVDVFKGLYHYAMTELGGAAANGKN